MKSIIKYNLEEGGEILVEVDEPEVGVVKVSRPDNLPIEASQSFQKALDNLKPIANAVITKLDGLSIPSDEISVEFGLTLKANAGMVLTSVGADANFKVNLKWKRND